MISENILNQQILKKPEYRKKDEGLTRRDFLKGIIGSAAVVAAGPAFETINRFVNKFENKENDTDEKNTEDPTEEQKEIENEDSISTKKILDFNNEETIEFDLKTTEAIKNDWKERYRNNPKLRNSLIKAYREIGYWQPYLEKIFEKRGVPKEFIFLAIPESHWQPNAVSKAGAAGPYQFMAKTARMYNLKVGQNYDERKDPLASARACADLLLDLYQATKDWKLALSGYNGGFIWEYLKKAKADEAEISYEDFLKFINQKLNLVKNDVKDIKHHVRVIKRGENLNDIAAAHGFTSVDLAKYNKIGNPQNIKIGQKIFIPLSQANKQIIYNKKISGFSENLNYPAKYYAIIELIDEGLVKEQEKPVTFDVKEVKQSAPSHNIYTAKADDKNLYRISKKLKVDFNELARYNPQAVKNLRAGIEIKIPNNKRMPITLADVARQTNKPIARLKFLNPAIKENAPIITDRIRV